MQVQTREQDGVVCTPSIRVSKSLTRSGTCASNISAVDDVVMDSSKPSPLQSVLVAQCRAEAKVMDMNPGWAANEKGAKEHVTRWDWSSTLA